MKENWTYKKLGEVCEIICGQDYKSIQDDNGMFPIYGTGGVMGRASQYRCPANSIIIGRKGNINNPLFVEEPFWNVDTAFGVVPNVSVLFPKFFYFFCKNYDFTKHDVSVTIPSLRRADIIKIAVPIPPLSEQSRIVSELDLLQSIIDKQKAQLKELDNLAQAVFYDMFGDPVENDKGWEVKKLGEVTNKISDGVHAKPNYTEAGMPFISVVNINRGKLNFDDCKYVSISDGESFNKRAKPEKGDVLYTKVGATYGIPAIVDVDIDFCLYVSVCLIKPNKELINSSFLTNMMRLPYIKHQADERIRGIGVPDLHLNQISAFDIILPPLSLQQSFASKIESIEKQKAAINQSIAETQRLFDYTMDKYFG